jgi:hypothetical protein
MRRKVVAHYQVLIASQEGHMKNLYNAEKIQKASRLNFESTPTIEIKSVKFIHKEMKSMSD